MKAIILLALFVGSVYGALSFTARVTVFNDPAISGIMTGTISYQMNSYTAIDSSLLNRYKIVWDLGVTEVLKTVAIAGTSPTQYQNIRYLKCASSCDAATWVLAFPFMQADTGRWAPDGSDSIGTKYTYGSAGANDVKHMWWSGSTLVRVQFGNGKVWAFSSYAAASFTATDFDSTGCPAPTCTVVADIFLILDQSGSVGSANFQKARDFGVNIVNSYTFAANGAAGVYMGVIGFSSAGRLVFGLSNSQTSVRNAVANCPYPGGGTCYSCGLVIARQQFDARTIRQTVPKVIFFMTDGGDNTRYSSGDSCYSSLSSPYGDCPYFPPYATGLKNIGTTIISIGVGSYVYRPQLVALASVLPGLTTVYSVTDFNALASFKDQIVGVTCQTFSGTPCGASCRGFCSCGATCLCPSCNTTNPCVIGQCTAGSQGSGCVYTNRDCNDGNFCTTDTCDPTPGTGGCRYTAVTCADTDACTDNVCVPSIGCTFPRKTCTALNSCDLVGCNSAATSGDPCTHSQNPACNYCQIRGNASNIRPCPDPNGRPEERDDGNKCKVWYCNNNLRYAPNYYDTSLPIGYCNYTMKNCDDGSVCTTDTCTTATGACVNTPINCDDGNYCTIDTCHPVNGCQHTLINASLCNSNDRCKRDFMNTSRPGCCQSVDIGREVCQNVSDVRDNKCLDCVCDYAQGPVVFARNCEAEIGLEKLGDCQSAECNPNATAASGCYAQVLTNKKLDKCGYCDGSTGSKNKCVLGDLTVSEVAGISAGVLAAIIIAIIVVCIICGLVGGKVGLDYYRKYQGRMNNLQSNPLYQEDKKGGVNPFYNDDKA